MKSRLYRFESREALLDALVSRIAENIGDAVAERGSASLLVSGGSTPKALFERLSHVALPWEKVTVSLVDERWVDVTSSESNEHLVRTSLLQNRAQKARFIGLKTDHENAKEGVTECEKRLTALPSRPDVVILGMGSDGHTASFFPHMPNLGKAMDMQSGARCIDALSPNAPHDRMTLTLPFLLTARNLLLHIEGEEKLRVFERAMGEGSIEDMPIRALLRQDKILLEVYNA